MADLSFSFTVSEENKTRIIDGIAYQHGYQDQIEDENGDMIDNPETKGAYAKRMAKKWIIENVKTWEVNQVTETARADKIAEVDSIPIT